MEETDQKQENNDGKKDNKKEKGAKKGLIKKILAILLALLLLLAAFYGGYWYKGQQAKKDSDAKQQQIDKLEEEKKKAEEELEAEKSEKSSSSDSTTKAKTEPSASDLENIEDSISSGNTAALEGYMASKVNVIMAASECCGSRTPSQAISDLNYIEAGTDPWDFSLPAATIAAYQAGYYSSYFPADALVGKSANDYVVSFTFDSNGDIDGIFMAINADLLV